MSTWLIRPDTVSEHPPIKENIPEAMLVTGYRTWQEELDSHLEEGDSVIWIWAPIPHVAVSGLLELPSYHEISGCECS